MGAAVLLGRIEIGDWLTALFAATDIVALFRWKISNPLWVAVTAVIGLIGFQVLHPT
jgi:chromate transporter